MLDVVHRPAHFPRHRRLGLSTSLKCQLEGVFQVQQRQLVPVILAHCTDLLENVPELCSVLVELIVDALAGVPD